MQPILAEEAAAIQDRGVASSSPTIEAPDRFSAMRQGDGDEYLLVVIVRRQS